MRPGGSRSAPGTADRRRDLFQRGGRRIRKTVRWYLMRPVAKVGEHDHEVDEVLWADRAEAEARLRYDSDRRLLAGVS